MGIHFANAIGEMLIVWVVTFLGDGGTIPRPALRLAWARNFSIQSQREYSSISSWIYIEWGTLIRKVSDSLSASSAPLSGMLHHLKHRAPGFIDINSD